MLFFLQLCESIPSPKGESVLNCGGISDMPDIVFTIADRPFTLTPEQVWDYFFVDSFVVI